MRQTRYFSDPFPHFHARQALDPDVALGILRWMKTSAPWRLVETDFYQQFEFSLRDVDIPNHLSCLGDGSLAAAVLEQMSSTFNLPLAEKVEIVAHKLNPGQRIRIHNDCLQGGETHRLVIQLNPSWTNANGGLFMVFTSANAEDVYRIIRPLHNTAVGFAISNHSHHAISTVYREARYSLICSFRAMP